MARIVEFIRAFVDEREFDHHMAIYAAPVGYPLFRQLGFTATGEEQVYCGGICSLMKLTW